MLGWRTAATALAIAMCAGTPVFAGDTTVAVQRLGPPAVEARREALLQQMIASPSDIDLAFEYAQLSSQVGDYEGAVSALERVLIYALNTPRIQLELGILYYRLGAYEVARSYFEQALFRLQAQRHRSRLLRDDLRPELQHAALEPGQDARLSLWHRRSRLSRL
jgi:tetratricopeptide (TPR) repeat protein